MATSISLDTLSVRYEKALSVAISAGNMKCKKEQKTFWKVSEGTDIYCLL